MVTVHDCLMMPILHPPPPHTDDYPLSPGHSASPPPNHLTSTPFLPGILKFRTPRMGYNLQPVDNNLSRVATGAVPRRRPSHARMVLSRQLHACDRAHCEVTGPVYSSTATSIFFAGVAGVMLAACVQPPSQSGRQRH